MSVRLLGAARALPAADIALVLRRQGAGDPPHAGLRAALAEAEATGDLATEFRKTGLFYPHGGRPKRLGAVGLGKAKSLTAERLRRAAAVAQKLAERVAARRALLVVDDDTLGGVEVEAAARALAEGLVLGAYRYQPPSKKKPKARRGQSFDVVYAGRRRREFERGLRLGRIGADATVFARDLENRGGNLVTPTVLAKEAQRLAGGSVRVKVMGKAEMTRLKMGAFLGVARGSRQPPKLIVLDHRPAGAKQTVCVVGKGLTFDSGGISLKPGAKMDEMRYDMCGAGAVLGLFAAIRGGALDGGRKVRIVGIVAAAENMPDGDAQKPGDVVTACDGTTIEILNTDAEGRLVLADAMAWAVKTYDPQAIVDLATLTGAVVVALGHEVAGVMGTDDALVQELIAAGEAADEPLWRLPLWEVHRRATKSKFADVANLGSAAAGAGSICAAAFLSYFVEGRRWAHIDIAGTAWGGEAKDYYESGASGTAVRMLIQWLRRRSG